MDIEKLKKEEDEKMDENERVEVLRKNAIFKFEKLAEISDKSNRIWSEKVKKIVDQLKQEFTDFFTKKGFEISRGNPFGKNGPVVTEINACYKGLQFTLSNINYEGEPINIRNSKDLNENICIKFPENSPDYFVLKRNIDIQDKRLITNYLEKTEQINFANKLDTEDEINKLIEILNVNIGHFQESIDKSNSINLCILRDSTNIEYKNFEELVEDLQNKKSYQKDIEC